MMQANPAIVTAGRPRTLAEVSEVRTTRFTSTFRTIDQVLGRSTVYDAGRRPVSETWGIPRGKLLVLVGDSGVGKTKFYTLIAIMLAETCGQKIVIFQNEMSVGEYKETVLNMYQALGMVPRNLDNIVVEHCKHLAQQLDILRTVKPDLAVNDSFNLTESPNAESKKGIQEIVSGWKEVMGDHTAGWFVAHQNAAGNIKGNGHLKYMVDGLFKLQWDKEPHDEWECGHPETYRGRYILTSNKNRQGPGDMVAVLQHRGDGVVVVERSVPEIEGPKPIIYDNSSDEPLAEARRRVAAILDSVK